MADLLISSHSLLDRLGREEQQMKRLGLHAQAAGVRAAIVILIKATQAGNDTPPPLDSLRPGVDMRLAFLLFLLAVLLLVAGAARPGDEAIVITRTQFEQLKREVEQMVRQREETAFEAGKAAANVRCGRLI